MKSGYSCSVAQSSLTLCGPMDCGTSGSQVLHHLPVFAQSHAHSVDDAIHPSHPVAPSPPVSLECLYITENSPFSSFGSIKCIHMITQLSPHSPTSLSYKTESLSPLNADSSPLTPQPMGSTFYFLSLNQTTLRTSHGWHHVVFVLLCPPSFI